MTSLGQVLPVAFGFAATIYLGLAVRAARTPQGSGNAAISYILLLVGAIVGGAAFWYAATDMTMFHIGRVLTLFAAGFMPVAMYRLYRGYIGEPPGPWLLAGLCVIPAVTTALALTNPVHGLLWRTELVDGVIRFSHIREYAWFRLVHIPYSYSLFGYALLALAGRVPSMPPAHRGPVSLILVCAVLPFVVNVGNTLLDIGPYHFPSTASTLTLMLPAYWWVTEKLGSGSFKPVAYQTLFDHVRDALIVLDDQKRIVSANRRARELLQPEDSALLGRPLAESLPEVHELFASEADISRTVRLGTGQYLEISGAPITSPQGESQGAVVVCRDVTERRNTLKALADSEQLIRSLVEYSSTGMLRFSRRDGDYVCVFANRAASTWLAIDGKTLAGTALAELPMLLPTLLCAHFGAPDDNREAGGRIETEVESADGEHWLRLVAEPVGNDFSVTLVDITEGKRIESRMLAEALQDSLTGVLNRRGFESRGPARLEACERGAVVYVDLNGFKAVNDRFGHPAGDALLKAFSRRMEYCLRPDDLVARLGGDEFAIVLPGVTPEDARHVAARLVDSASEAYIIQGQEIRCAASVGIALKPAHGSDLAELVGAADRAMYEAKSLEAGEAANDRSAYVEAQAVNGR